jgi:hypothetical protein
MNIERPKSKQPIPDNAKRVFKGVLFDVYLEDAIKIFYERKNKTPAPTSEFLTPSLRRMYMAIPKKISINRFEKGRTPPDWKEEITL